MQLVDPQPTEDCVEFIDFEAARQRSGLRLVVVSRVPSPWGEAAKGILHVKKIPFAAVRLEAGNAELAAWTGQSSAPVALYDDEPPRGGWAEILLLAERLEPRPRLLPEAAEQRAVLLGLAHEICGEMGLGWCRRLEGIAAGLEGRGGFPGPVAQYLADKYGYRPGIAAEARRRVHELLALLASRLGAERQRGSDYYLGDGLTALDIYSATFMALFDPLPPEQCPMPDALRAAFGQLDDETRAALDPALLDHRDRIYARHLALPLSL
jgi:glutathione S-transferase